MPNPYDKRITIIENFVSQVEYSIPHKEEAEHATR